MKKLALLLIASLSLEAAELRVTLPNDHFGHAIVERMSDHQYIEDPEPKISQEDQIAVLEYQNLKPGKYRVRYISALDPLGFLDPIMETHVDISDKSKESVILFQPRPSSGPTLPKDIEQFLMDHRKNYSTLDVTFDGFRYSFDDTRGTVSICRAFRSDCEYHIEVWNHSYEDFPKNSEDRKVIFKKSFRAVARSVDPFFHDASPQNAKESEGGTDQPATTPQLKSEKNDKPRSLNTQ